MINPKCIDYVFNFQKSLQIKITIIKKKRIFYESLHKMNSIIERNCVLKNTSIMHLKLSTRVEKRPKYKIRNNLIIQVKVLKGLIRKFVENV